MKNTEISRILGQKWHSASIKEKHPYVEREICEREQYKISVTEWKKEQEAIKLAKKEGASTSGNSVNIVDANNGIERRPVSIDGSVSACEYNPQDYNSQQDSSSPNTYRRDIVRYEQYRYDQHPYIHSQYPCQEYNINNYT